VPTYSCADIAPTALDPPTSDKFGLNPGIEIDGRQITTDGMSPLLHPLTNEPILTSDGKPVRTKLMGIIERKPNGELGGDISALPSSYGNSWRSAIQLDEVRWTMCQMEGGVQLVATDASEQRNARYDGANEYAEYTFLAGQQDNLFNETRDLAYTQIHEGGHFVRHQILVGDNKPAQELVDRIEGLYEQHLSVALEEYRTTHGQQVLDDLVGIESQFAALDSTITDAETKQTAQRAITYLKKKLAEPGGLGEMAINPRTDEDRTASFSGLDGMIAKALEATAEDGRQELYGVGEYFADYSDKLDGMLLKRTYEHMVEFLTPRFIAEDKLSGFDGGHSWEDSNELFAGAWHIAGQVSPDNYHKILDTMPAPYQPIARRQLETAAELRRAINPHKPLTVG
jgi:hypothetical protein